MRLLTLVPILFVAACAQSPVVSPGSPAPFNFDAWVQNAEPLLPRDTGDLCSTASPRFAFGASAVPGAHAFVCRQDGPHRGWYRQRIRGLHVNSSLCPNGATSCDSELVRICQAPLIEAPCTGSTSPTRTGPNGCAVCGTPEFTNHAP